MIGEMETTRLAFAGGIELFDESSTVFCFCDLFYIIKFELILLTA